MADQVRLSMDRIREAKIKTFLSAYFKWEQEDDKRPLLDYFPSGMPVEELPERIFLPYAPEGMCPLGTTLCFLVCLF